MNNRCRRFSSIFCVISGVALLCLCPVMRSHGQALSIYNVTGAGGLGTWDVAGNWIPAGIPNGAGSIVSITSNITASSQVDLSAPHTIGMMFIGDQNNTNLFTVSGSTLTFDNSPYGNAFLSKVLSPNRVDVISANIVLLSNLDINVNPGGSGVELNISGVISGAFGINTMGGGRVRFSGAAANTYTGLTTVYMRGYGDATNPNLLLSKTAGINAIAGDLKIGNVSQGGSGSAVVQLGASNQIADTSIISFDGSSGNNPYFKLMGFDETVRGIVDYTREGVIEVTEGESGVVTNSTLTLATLAGDQSYYSAYMRNRAGGTSTGILNIAVTGSGTQTLSGDRINYTGTTTIGVGATLVLENASNFNSSSVSNNGTLKFNLTNGDRTFNKVISGTGAFSRTGNNILHLNSTGTAGVALEFSSVYINGGTTNFNTAVNVGVGGVVIDGTTVGTTVNWNSAAVTYNVGGDLTITGANAVGGTSTNPTLNINTSTSITGAINIAAATIQVNPGSTLGAATSINISDGGVLSLFATTAGTQDRIGDTTSINLNGSRFGFYQGGPVGAKTETVGALSLTGGVNLIETLQGGGGDSSTLTFSSLSRSAGTTLRFTDTAIGNAIDKVVFTAVPALDAGGLLGGWATVGTTAGAGLDFATYTAGSVAAISVYNSGAETTWVAADNVKVSANRTLTAARTINSLNIQDTGASRTLALVDKTLTVNSGGIISSGPTIGGLNHIISGTNIGATTGKLTAGSSGGVSAGLYELNTIVHNNTLSINALIGNNGANVVSLVKSGAGTLIIDPEASISSTWTAGNPIVTLNLAGAAASMTLGAVVTGTGIPNGSYITSIDVPGNKVTLSVAPLNNGAATALSYTIANTFTGSTTINEGIVRLLFEGNLGAAPAVAGNNLIFNGGTLQVARNMTLDDAGRNVLIRAGDGTIQVDYGRTVTIANTVTSIEGGRLLLNAVAGAAVTQTTGYSTTIGLNTITGDTFGLFVGALVDMNGTNANIDDNAVVTAILSPTSFTIGTVATGTSALVNTQFQSRLNGRGDGTLILTGAGNDLSGGLESAGTTLDGGLILNGTGTGTIGLIRLFGGSIDIRGTNTFNKDIIMKGGLLILAGTNTFLAGIDHSVTLDGGELRLNSATAISSGYALSMTTATYNLNGFNTSVRSLTGGTASIIDNKGAANSVLTVNQISNTTYAGSLRDDAVTSGITNITTGSTLSLLKTGNGMLTLSDLNNSYDGSTTINAGVLNILQLSYGQFGSSIGSSSYAPANLVINGGTLRYSGNAASAQTGYTDRSFTLGLGASAGAIIADGVGLGSVMQFIPSQPFVGAGFTGTLPIAFSGAGARTLTLGGANRGENFFGLVLNDGGGATSLNKIGNGLWRVEPFVYAKDSTWLLGGNVITISDTTNLTLGQLVYPGYGFPVGTYITAITPNVSVTVSQNATDVTYSGDPSFPIPFMGSNYSGETVIKAGILSTAQNGSFGTGKVIVGGGTGGLVAPGLYNATLELRGVDYTGYGGALQALIMEGGTLSATNNFAVTDSSWAGSVTIAANANLSVTTGAQLTLSGTMSGMGSLTQLGEGTVVLSGVNDATRNASNTASYTVQAGKLVLDYGTNVGSKLSDTAALSLGGGRLGATVEIRGGAAVREIVGGVTLNAGDNIITRTSGTSSLRMNAITRNTGATVDFSANDIASTTSANVNGILGAWATINGTDWATKSAVLDAGTNFFIEALAPAGYTASTATNDWVALANMDALFTATGDNIQNTRSANTLRFNAQSTTTAEMTVRLRNLNTLTGGGILVTSAMGTDAAVIGQFDATGALTTTATDLLILQNNPNAPLVISAIIQGAIGLDKLGVGNLILTGTNTYTGVTTLNAGSTTIKTLTNAGVASGIGTANVVAPYNYLVFNGGSLQFNGAAGVNTSNRGYTVNSLAIWDVGNVNTTLTLTGQYLTAAAEGDYAVKKIGSGVLELSGTLAGGYGINSWEVSDGTARLIAGNANDQFARNLDATLTMSGGTFEMVGGGAASTFTASQNFKGRLSILEGASTIKVRSLAGVAQPAILNLQDASDPQPIRFGRGSSLLLIEDMTSGNVASITIAGQFGVDVQMIIPRAVYSRVGASIYPGVNYFVVVDGNGNNVVASDNDEFGSGIASHVIASDVTDTSNWNPPVFFLNVTDGALAGAGYNGTTTVDSTVNTLRFYNNQDIDSIVTIGAANLLTIDQGAILQTTHSGNTLKAINGGQLTSNLTNADDATVDLLVHNWNPLRALEISSVIVDNVATGSVLNFIQSGNGTTTLSGANTYTGTTYVQGGVLRLDNASALPGGIGAAGGLSHLRLDGGVVGLNAGDFNRALGTGADQVDWTSSGGFAAYTADRTVNLGGAGVTVTWGAGSFVPDNDIFILGAYDADKMLVFANGINLGRKDRMIKAVDGSADFDGQLTGVLSGEVGGILTKAGQGGLQITNTNTYKGGTVLAQGLLHGTVNSSFGTGAINIGSTSDTNAVDALEFRYGGSTLTNAITVGNATLGNIEGISTIRTTNATIAVSGLVNLQKQTFAAPASGTTATVSSVVSGTRGLTLIDGGTLSLTNNANSYGTSSGAAGAAVSGGTVIRSGTLLIGASGALSATAVELGDATYAKTAAAYATTRTVLGVERTILDNADGLSALGGEFVANANGTRSAGDTGFLNAGQGAFYNINKTIDGYTFLAADVVAGTRILVKDETENPERNGIYKVVYLNADGTMNITRVSDFDDTTDMLYGSQVAVTSGTVNAGKTYFMASPDIAIVNGIGTDPSQWIQDLQVNPNVSLYATAASLAITNALDVNANGSGATTIGTIADLTGVTFSGNVTLQDVQSALAETKTLTLASASLANPGVTFSGIFSEGAVADILSIIKSGGGVATLSGVNTFKGTANVQTGTLRITNSSALGAADGLAGTGTTVTSGATLEIDGTSGDLVVGNEALTISGTGVSSAGAVFVRGGSDNTWAGGVTLAAAATVNVNAAAKLTFSNVVQGGFALSKIGAGTLALSGANTYSGDTNVTAGTLLINNTSGSGTGTGAVSVSNAGTTLGGSGLIVAGAGKSVTLGAGTVLSVGTPGSVVAEDLNITTSGAGVITFSGNLGFDLYTTNGSAGLNPNTANDRLLLAGPNAAVLGGSSILAVNSIFAINATNYAVGSIWDLIDWTALAPAGTFSNITATTGNFANLPDLSSFSREWNFASLYTSGQISVVAVVPEPGRLGLLVVALAFAILRRRRKV